MEISKIPTMQIKGDFTDLHQEWKDQLHKLMRVHNVKEFIIVADISAAPVFSANDTINIAQFGAGQVTLAQGSGVTINSTGATTTAPKLRMNKSSASIICTASNTFLVVGDIS